MIRRLLLPAAAAGLIGLAALVFLFPRYDPAATLRYRLDRPGAIERGEALAAGLGCPFQPNQRVYVSSKFDEKLRYWQQYNRREPLDSLVSPMRTLVWQEDSGGAMQRQIQLAPDGSLMGYYCRVAGKDQSASARAVADAALRRLVGPLSSRFTITSDGVPEDDAQHYSWTATGARSPEITYTAHIDVVGSRVQRAMVDYAFADSLRRPFDASFQRLLYLVSPSLILTYGFLLAGMVLYIAAAVKGRVNHRLVAVLVAAVLLTSLIRVATVGDTAVLPGAPSAARGARMVGQIAGLLMLALVFAALIGFGESLSRAAEIARWRSLRLAVARQWRTREVGASVAGGILLGLALAALPVALAASGLLPYVIWGSSSIPTLLSPRPALRLLALNSESFMGVLTIFVVVIPFLRRIVRARLFWAVGVCVLGLLAATPSPFYLDWLTVLVFSFGRGLLYFWAYERFGMLGLVCLAVAADAATLSATLLSTESPWLQRAGLIGAAELTVLLAASVTVALRGREAPAEAAAAPEPDYVPAREQLRGAFSLAHQAQQKMLPAEPPRAPGFSLAGLCQPARDVGGDLYDYVRLADGRYGICVADVSGKGMPAALYMTLTKGLLAAAAQDSGDPAIIAAQLNRHLYAACRRRMFVTAVLGALDPATREFEYVRAGHNPTVYYEAATGQTSLLSGPGLGLGIAPERTFARSLRSQQMRLAPGDVLVFYSDGVTEAMDASQEQFGEERLMACVAEAARLSSAAARDSILAAVQGFLNGTHPQDDITIVVLRAETTDAVIS